MVSSNDIFCPLSIFIFLFYNDLQNQMRQNVFLKKGSGWIDSCIVYNTSGDNRIIKVI